MNPIAACFDVGLQHHVKGSRTSAVASRTGVVYSNGFMSLFRLRLAQPSITFQSDHTFLLTNISAHDLAFGLAGAFTTIW